MKRFLFILILLLISILYYLSYNNIKNYIEHFESLNKNNILDISNRKFPFRYFKDENNNILPIVAITAFFRSDEDKKLYYNYINFDIKVIGVTAYKTFPLKIRDNAEDKYHLTDDFNYTKEIKIWLTCMNNLELYNFDFQYNKVINMSESDFYDIDIIDDTSIFKKYDFIYICNKDTDECPLNGWNAINRNYALALKCFPIMINEYNLKGLCVGRINCNELNIYKDNITVTDFIPWNELQQKMRESKFLFVPNIYDASPRVVVECLIKNVPVLMNSNIICGFKYINENTGEFFIDENNIRNGLDNILYKIANNLYNIKDWWNNNYGINKSSVELRNFLYQYYPNILKNTQKVSFII